jgi:hypothetical protein
MCRTRCDQIRAVLKARQGAAGHRWIHSDRVVRVQPHATGAAAKATGDLNRAGAYSSRPAWLRCQSRRYPLETTPASGPRRTAEPSYRQGRRLTEELIDGLEVIPRKPVEYRGRRLEEMDLDAILRRRPEVALVDELAHTNVPGSGGHEKRWQDLLDILGAGISVITTVNIQHLESSADEVEQMTGARIRERVPD